MEQSIQFINEMFLVDNFIDKVQHNINLEYLDGDSFIKISNYSESFE